MKPGNLQLQGAKSGGANRKMRLYLLQERSVVRSAFSTRIGLKERNLKNGKKNLYI